MAPPVLSDDEKKAALSKGGANLKYLFGRNDVSRDIMAIWFHVGVTTVEKFANIAKDEADLLAVLKNHIGVDQDASLEQRVQAASLTCAWSNARTRVQRSAEVEAEMDSNEWRKPIVASEWLAMKAGLEGAVGILDDSVMPSKEYVEKKLQELEAGDYRAEDLTEVVSRDQVDPDSLLPQWDARGNLTVRRGATKVKEPESPEGLRKRLTIMRNAYQMVALKHTNRPELQGDYVRTFEEYKDYLLGEHVYGLNARDADGLVIAAPPFRLVLAYEKAIRKETAKKMNQEGIAMPIALKQSWKCPTTKERHFTTPLALVAKRPAPPPWRAQEQGAPAKRQKQEPKGGGKGKSKAPQGCAQQTKEGQPVCYRYNTPNVQCKKGKCRFAHVCGICLSDKHPMFQCSGQKRQPPDTTGGSHGAWKGFTFLYLFSGRRRKTSVGSFVKKLAAEYQVKVTVLELDIRYNKRWDFTSAAVRRKWLSFISQGGADALLVTPPCSTFSRAHWANDEGPLPLRSSVFPRGFPWNSYARKHKAWQGNVLADFSFEAMEAQLAHSDRVAAMEQPEDLGKPPKQRIPNQRPASMWQWQQHAQLASQESTQSVALSQLDFGSPHTKPTRLLFRIQGQLHPAMYSGLPEFDEEGSYIGPLPRKVGLPLIGKHGGQYRTAVAAEWPPDLCLWMAQQVLLSFQRTSATRGKQDEGQGRKRKREAEIFETPTKEAEPGQGCDPFFPPVPGGEGRCRACEWKGGETAFHDGGCLQSPGRWDHGKRSYPMDEGWKEARRDIKALLVKAAGGEARLEKECFSMSRGGSGVKLAKDEKLLEEVRKRLWELCGRPEGAMKVAEGQPFFLGLMREVLKRAGDSDCEFLKQAEEGLPLGVKNPLPRTPQSFEEQTQWALQDDPTMEYATVKANYPSAREHEEHLRKHLEKEVEEGLMTKMTRRQFEEKFGEDRAVAALAVLVEDDITGKKRVIHDGTHDIRVNHRIKCRDKLRMPGGKEKKYLLRMFRRARDVVFSVIGDFGKAHRRFKYLEEEHGFLGCVVKEEENMIYVNKVGAFGIGSTPYWWGRISGAMVRLCHAVLGPGVPLELLLYADDLEVMSVGKEGRKGAVECYVVLAAMGAPFKWEKQRGGMETEWIGLMTNYGDYSFGLSPRRAGWLADWIDKLTKEKVVSPREFIAGLGRLGFAATALQWEKPFLGPLYTWASAVLGQRGKVILPWAVMLILNWIGGRLRTGGGMEKVSEEKGYTPGHPVIYTDARASDDDACLGGFLAVSDDLKQCPWFSVRVDTTLAPWLFAKGGSPKRVIASLELLATLLAVKIWAAPGDSMMTARLKAFTDNRGNSFALKRGMSTKFPLALLIIELAEEMRARDLRVDLEWLRRDNNTDADDLSNEDWKKFNEEKRVCIDTKEVKWIILEELMKKGKELYDEVTKLKEEKKRSGGEGAKKSVGNAAGPRKILPKWWLILGDPFSNQVSHTNGKQGLHNIWEESNGKGVLRFTCVVGMNALMTCHVSVYPLNM